MTILQFPALFHCTQTLSHARNIVLYLPILVDLLTIKHSLTISFFVKDSEFSVIVESRRLIRKDCFNQMKFLLKV